MSEVRCRRCIKFQAEERIPKIVYVLWNKESTRYISRKIKKERKECMYPVMCEQCFVMMKSMFPNSFDSECYDKVEQKGEDMYERKSASEGRDRKSMQG